MHVYRFQHQTEDSTFHHEFQVESDVTYTEVIENFGRFLRGIYGYRIEVTGETDLSWRLKEANGEC